MAITLNELTIEDAISDSAMDLLFFEPFYAHFFSSLNRVISEEIPTACIGVDRDAITMKINPNFFLKELNKQERIAVLKHELLHLGFAHIFKKFNGDRLLLNIAADLVVNQFLNPFPIPKGAIILSGFADLKLLPMQSLEYYLDKLQTLADKMQKQGWFHGSKKKFDWNKLSNPRSAELLESISRNWDFSGHDSWGKIELTDLESNSKIGEMLERAKKLTEEKFWGGIPREFQQIIKAHSGKDSSIDWKKAIRLLGARCSAKTIGMSIKRKSKRYGTRPGLRSISNKRRLAVAIDTSGSIDQNQMADFLKEIQAIRKTGAIITIFECDCKIHREYELKSESEIKFKGGGGTAFDPVFERVNKERVKPFDGILYLTDGFASKPTIQPTKSRLLWVISPNGTTKNLDFGPFVKMS